MKTVLKRGFELVEAALNLLSTVILFVLLLYVTAEVLMRTLFNSPLPGHLELSQLLIAAAVFLGLSYAQARRSHVNMDIVISWLPARPALAVDTLTLLLSLAAWAVIVWFSWEGARNAFEIGDVTPTSDVPTWWSKIAVSIGGAVLCLRFLGQIGQNLVDIVQDRAVHPSAIGRRHTREELGLEA